MTRTKTPTKRIAPTLPTPDGTVAGFEDAAREIREGWANTSTTT